MYCCGLFITITKIGLLWTMKNLMKDILFQPWIHCGFVEKISLKMCNWFIFSPLYWNDPSRPSSFRHLWINIWHHCDAILSISLMWVGLMSCSKLKEWYLSKKCPVLPVLRMLYTTIRKHGRQLARHAYWWERAVHT